MKKKITELKTGNNSHTLCLSAIEYIGTGCYQCILKADSDGFMCERPFNFDNDEYFLAKLRSMQRNIEAQAELSDLGSENYLRFTLLDADFVLVVGYIEAHEEYTQSIEFAFRISNSEFSDFVAAFAAMVQSFQ